MSAQYVQIPSDDTGEIDSARLSPADIAILLPASWAFSFVDIKAALNYYYPKAIVR